MKDWEARFASSERRRSKNPLRSLLSFSWAAFTVALIYAVLLTWILIRVSRDSDPEAQTAGWFIFGFPWFLACGPRPWFVVPLNAFTVYFVVATVILICRTIVPRRP